jgi:hypothetical protein
MDLIVALLVLRRHIWWLIALPLLAGVITYVVVVSRPATFTSVTTLLLDDGGARKAEAYMASGTVQDTVRKQHPDASSRVHWTTTTGEPRRTASLFNLLVEDRNPDNAKAVAVTLLNGWLELTKPRPDEKTRITKELQRTKAELQLAEELIQKLQTEAPRLAGSPQNPSGSFVSALSALTSLLERRDDIMQVIAKAERDLAGMSRDVILSQPSVPLHPDPTRAEKYAAAAVGITLLVTAAFILFLHLMTRIDGMISSKRSQER